MDRSSSWYFHTGDQAFAGGTLSLEHCQQFDGTPADPPSIHVDNGEYLSPSEAREMATALTTAADLLDGSAVGGVQ